MSNVRDLSRKISSLQNMQKVTRAMNMISSIKLRKFLACQNSVNLFQRETDRIRNRVMAALGDSSHPVTAGYEHRTRVHLIVFTADKGLCGTHNSSILKSADAFAREHWHEGREVEFTCIGIKGINHGLRSEWDIFRKEESHEKAMTREVLSKMGDKIYGRFLSGEIQEVWILGNHFVSTLQQDTTLERLLPLPGAESEGSREEPLEAEPEGDILAAAYGEIYLKDRLRSFLIHSSLSEQSARLTAMENATNNSEDLINKYVTMQNHARQATITNELIEIVSGKEALKG
ncbi:MAG: ATP synthase F1 subunit gamma [Spirochaetales bacterium]|nr:ATP synthase F1 subunit gamma [Spirochaetales bacterium]